MVGVLVILMVILHSVIERFIPTPQETTIPPMEWLRFIPTLKEVIPPTDILRFITTPQDTAIPPTERVRFITTPKEI